MFGMRISVRAHPITGCVMALPLLASAMLAKAETLSLQEAETLALSQDPSIESVQASRQALDEREVAAGQLPDPMLKLGAVSLPTDSFDLEQEPMTQLQVGLVQKFPRGQSRSLRAEQIRERSRGLGETARDLGLRIRLAVREEYLEVQKQQRLARINREAVTAFKDLADITEGYYATGQVQQQDVLRAAVELAKVQERGARISEEEERARARLAAWIGAAANSDVAADWAGLTEPGTADAIISRLPGHPRLLALQQDWLAAEKGVELARQNYKPEFSVDLTYGARAGYNADGSGRADLLSLMVVMDLPLFREQRQDRLTAASVAESSAASFSRDDMFRRMRSEVEMYASTLRRQRDRLGLFERSLLPDAQFNSEAAFQAYQEALEDLTTLMRARITEFDLQLDHARLQADMRKTQARLLYLQGDES